MKLIIKKSVMFVVLFAMLFFAQLGFGKVGPEGIIAASDVNKIQIFNAKTGEIIKTLKGHKKSVDSVVFSPDGKYLASGDLAGIVKIWDTEKWENTQTLTGHKNRVNSVAFSIDSLLLASASDDKKIRIYKKKAGKWKIIQVLDALDKVYSVAFSPKITNVLVTGQYGTTKIWKNTSKTGWKYKNVQTFKKLASCPNNKVSFSSDGCIISVSCKFPEIFDKEGSVWKKAKFPKITFPLGAPEYTIPMTEYALFSPKNPNIIAFRGFDYIRFFDKEGKLLKKIETLSGCNSMAFSPDGKYIVVGFIGEKIQIFDIKKGELISILKSPKKYVLSLAWYSKPKVTKKLLKQKKKADKKKKGFEDVIIKLEK
ncbi:WD40 repeat domain-containing protein [Candidatus Dependentiae bacterium]